MKKLGSLDRQVTSVEAKSVLPFSTFFEIIVKIFPEILVFKIYKVFDNITDNNMNIILVENVNPPASHKWGIFGPL